MLAWITLSSVMAAVPCTGFLDQVDVIACALESNPEVLRAKLELDALTGQKQTAAIWLPSNPVLQLSAGRRAPQGGATAERPAGVDWTATLSQEVEIAGQRGARITQADAEIAGQVRRLDIAQREAIASVLAAFYDLVAAKSALVLAERVAALATNMETLAEAQVEQSLLAPVDADVASAEALRLAITQIDAERRHQVAKSTLAILLGGDENADVEVADDFTPPPLPLGYESGRGISELIRRGIGLRGEVAASETERLVTEQQLTLLRRDRVPNLTLSVYASQDSTTERVIGGGLSFPLTLPAPVGQSRAGQIAEALARIEQTRADITLVQRRVRQEIVAAAASEQMTAKIVARFRSGQIERAHKDLTVLREALTTRQMTLREALVAQRSLIELLQSHVSARLAHALARLELLRASGAPIQGVRP